MQSQQTAFPFESEELSPYLTLEWHYARHLVIYRIQPGLAQDATQQFGLMQPVLLAWPPDRVYLSIFDYSHPELVYNAELRQAGQRFANNRPEVRGYSAIILANTIIGQFAVVYVKTLQGHGGRERKIFFSEAPALAWLRPHLPAEYRI